MNASRPPAASPFARLPVRQRARGLPAGAAQRFLCTRASAPAVNVVFLPGRDGIVNVQKDGSLDAIVGRHAPFWRNRNAFASRGLPVAPRRAGVAFEGGRSEGCGHHLFSGIDPAFVDAIAGFVAGFAARR